MTVQQLRDLLDEHCPNPDEEVPLSLVIDDLCYVVSALEQFVGIAEMSGGWVDPEVERFISEASASL